MKLSAKDFWSSIVAIAAVVALVAALIGYDWSLFATWKGAIGTMGILGLLMVLIDGADFERANGWSALEGLLTLAGAGLVIAGLIVVSKVLFILLAADILAFWLVSISRHEFSHEAISPKGTIHAT